MLEGYYLKTQDNQKKSNLDFMEKKHHAKTKKRLIHIHHKQHNLHINICETRPEKCRKKFKKKTKKCKYLRETITVPHKSNKKSDFKGIKLVYE